MTTLIMHSVLIVMVKAPEHNYTSHLDLKFDQLLNRCQLAGTVQFLSET